MRKSGLSFGSTFARITLYIDKMQIPCNFALCNQRVYTRLIVITIISLSKSKKWKRIRRVIKRGRARGSFTRKARSTPEIRYTIEYYLYFKGAAHHFNFITIRSGIEERAFLLLEIPQAGNSSSCQRPRGNKRISGERRAAGIGLEIR